MSRGRHQVKARARRRSTSFSLSRDDLIALEVLAERDGVSLSEALRRALAVYKLTLPEDVRREVVTRQRDAERDARVPVAWRFPAICPQCSDASNIVRFPDGQWECNLCGERGRARRP